jgi:hypothetical protein
MPQLRRTRKTSTARLTSAFGTQQSSCGGAEPRGGLETAATRPHAPSGRAMAILWHPGEHRLGTRPSGDPANQARPAHDLPANPYNAGGGTRTPKAVKPPAPKTSLPSTYRGLPLGLGVAETGAAARGLGTHVAARLVALVVVAAGVALGPGLRLGRCVCCGAVVAPSMQSVLRPAVRTVPAVVGRLAANACG